MTCNPSWPEIKEHLSQTDEVQNKHDLVSRVFRAKVEELKTDILKRQVFGRVAGFMYTIEFQKRGLPHAHFLIILADEHKLLTPESYDRFVCAELPDSKKDCDLYSLVIKHMMHGPCGKLNPTNICMKNNNCKFKYPKDFAEQTLKGKNSYPIYFQNEKNRKSCRNKRTNKDAMQLLLLYKEFPEYFVWSSKEKMWTRRKQRIVIGRVVTCHPTEGERYYLRLLLINVRGPKSYQDLCKVDGNCCSTFREAAEKRGLLHCDNNLVECMSEATNYQMPYSLRRLFATLLVYCNPANPTELWKQFEDSMSEDFKILPNMNAKDIRFMALNHINDILHLMGRDINEYNLIPEKIKPSAAIRETNVCQFERNIIVREKDLLLERKLNTERKAYDTILDRIFSNKSGAFFVDRAGGTGKTFLYRALLAGV
ncbi:uncharacterized protein LOC142162063 [Nicotiana tabacum]|uniref:Uncharacterized protein LOC142162063 n=1 Tax=Nicotiana tabacum TaxID=4097 RepID=A0AC58RP55_TOBAC